MTSPHPPPPARPRVVGHRGAAAHAPENTLASFRRALADGAELLECDVHLSRDGQAVVIHDETVDRTAQDASPRRSGAVADLSRADLDEVLLPGGERIPALAELLALTTVPVFVEVKAVPAARVVAELLRDLPPDSPAAGSTVISFHAEALAQVRRVSGIPVSYLVRDLTPQAVRTAVRLGAVGIGPAVAALTRDAAATARAAGLRVNPWTVNTAEQLQRALDCGADTITTDDPAWARRELAAR